MSKLSLIPHPFEALVGALLAHKDHTAAILSGKGLPTEEMARAWRGSEELVVELLKAAMMQIADPAREKELASIVRQIIEEARRWSLSKIDAPLLSPQSSQPIAAGGLLSNFDTVVEMISKIGELTRATQNRIFSLARYDGADTVAGKTATARPVGEQRDFESFVESARRETRTASFTEWADGDRVTLAIVFTDVVGWTALREALKDEAMGEVRRAHFAQSRKLIEQHKGREIKTEGDKFMAAFRSVDKALDYARALYAETGHARVQIRAGIHIGPMDVDENDVFGSTVDFAARVVGGIEGPEIWLSNRAKEDLNENRAQRHARLKWERKDDVRMKGFSGGFTLWSMRE